MDLLGLLGRAALVFVLLGLTLWAVRRTDGGRRLRSQDSPLQVLSSTRVGKGASVALVRIAGRAYALGVTEHSVTLLTETELPAPAGEPAAAGPPAARDGQPAGTVGAAAERPTFAAALQASAAQLLARPGSRSTGTPERQR